MDEVTFEYKGRRLKTYTNDALVYGRICMPWGEVVEFTNLQPFYGKTVFQSNLSEAELNDNSSDPDGEWTPLMGIANEYNAVLTF